MRLRRCRLPTPGQACQLLEGKRGNVKFLSRLGKIVDPRLPSANEIKIEKIPLKSKLYAFFNYNRVTLYLESVLKNNIKVKSILCNVMQKTANADQKNGKILYGTTAYVEQ